MVTRFDVVVVGGGPAGAICAARLAQRGASVVVFEKERFPRFHLGESLLPHTLPVLEAVGALDEVDATSLRKHGARFHDDARGVHDRFAFDGAWRPEHRHAYQVKRAAFDALLLRHAARSGAVVREGEAASRVRFEGGRAVGVETGDGERVDARFVVDASGRAALLSRARGAVSALPDLDQTALFAHFEGVARGEGDEEGDVDIVLLRDDPRARPEWIWVIPFDDGTASVGAVVSRAWLRRARLAGAGDDASALLDAALAAAPSASRLVRGAARVWPRARASADFSYGVRDLEGPGWLAVGDAAGFIDPLFSSGVHLAAVGGLSAADAILRALEEPTSGAVEGWARALRAASDTFLAAVRAFYAGPLVDYLFADNKHTALRRSVTSLLAGDVFHDAVWLRDARRRIAEMSER